MFGFVGEGTVLTLAASVILTAPVVVLVLAFGPLITAGFAGFTGIAAPSVEEARSPSATRRWFRVGLDAPSATLLLVGALGAVVFAHDGRPFRILSATSRVEGLDVRVEDGGAKTLHSLEVRVDPASHRDLRTGEIVVATDHARQPEAKLAVYVATTPESASSTSTSTDGGSR